MKNTKKLVKKLTGAVKSFGVTTGTVSEVAPILTVSVSSTRLRKGKELTVCKLPTFIFGNGETFNVGDKVLILFSEDNTKAFLIGVLEQ